VAVILGSGLGDAVLGDLAVEEEFAFDALPGFPPPSMAVPGHARRMAIGELFGVPAVVFRGRIHLYEGHGVGPTTLIPRLAAGLGAGVLVVTNAAGGLRPTMRPGQLMLLRDHLNFMGVNPLAGWHFPDGTPAFVPLPEVYDAELASSVRDAAEGLGLDLLEGVYAGLPGPSFETPAETRFLADAGADAVGMSTVPEAVSAVALGLRVVGLSCITNVAGTAHGHDEVLVAARGAAGDLRDILKAVMHRMRRTDGL
jgi:purine-nucleoside phosphorylase